MNQWEDYSEGYLSPEEISAAEWELRQVEIERARFGNEHGWSQIQCVAHFIANVPDRSEIDSGLYFDPQSLCIRHRYGSLIRCDADVPINLRGW